MEAGTAPSGRSDVAKDPPTSAGGAAVVEEPKVTGREVVDESLDAAGDVEVAGDDPIGKAANGQALTDREEMDATAWLLADDPEVGRATERMLRINVRSDDNPLYIPWKVRAITDSELRGIQKETSTPRARRQAIAGTGSDDLELHCRVIAKVTIEPDLAEAAKEANGGKQVANLARFVRGRFSHKPGLLVQISQTIMGLSGFDESDVQEVEAARG